MKHITFAVASNGREILRNNLLFSPCLRDSNAHQVLIQEGFLSASKAYNDAIDKSCNDLIVFAHQDVIFPDTWIHQLETALDKLDTEDPNWGVIGCYGETIDNGGRGYIYSSGRGILGRPFDSPIEIQTLDEIVLILRKSSGLRFDDGLPHFHFYGADICMRAAELGMRSYAISAFCVHNTKQTLVLPPEFYDSYRHIKRTWKARLPIQTTCVRITNSDIPKYRRRLQDVYLKYVRQQEIGGSRSEDVARLLAEVRSLLESGAPAAYTF
jgi:Glycosyltransferase like family